MDREVIEGRALLSAPFPWFGGKSRVAKLVWSRLGDTANYVDLFAGSLAILLQRPYPIRTETVNDADAYLVNLWRALKYAPEETAEYADWPVSEVDLLARHRWLVSTGAERIQALKTDPEFYDPKVAGWYVWGLCLWIGDGWCASVKPPSKTPELYGDKGINRQEVRKLPYLSSDGQGIKRSDLRLAGLSEYFKQLQERLRDVRITCGDWTRMLSPSVTTLHGITAMIVDPPYEHDDHAVAYTGGSVDVQAVERWCAENGENPLFRIALFGYEGHYKMPKDWEVVAWKANGGMGNRSDGKGRENAKRERIWFSPHCLRPDTQASLDLSLLLPADNQADPEPIEFYTPEDEPENEQVQSEPAIPSALDPLEFF